MLGIGPMRDVTIGEAVSSAPGAVAGQGSSRGPPQLVACSGQGKQGALAILRRSLVPELILKTSTPGQPLSSGAVTPLPYYLICTHKQTSELCPAFECSGRCGWAYRRSRFIMGCDHGTMASKAVTAVAAMQHCLLISCVHNIPLLNCCLGLCDAASMRASGRSILCITCMLAISPMQ